MKKLMLFAAFCCLQISVFASAFKTSPESKIAPISANDRALHHFKANYADAPDAAWYNSQDGEIYCAFHKNGESNWVFYDSRGFWKCSLIGYAASHLDPAVKDMVLNYFNGYHISYVYEIRSNRDEPIYTINIEDKDNIKVIQVAGENVEVNQALKKM